MGVTRCWNAGLGEEIARGADCESQMTRPLLLVRVSKPTASRSPCSSQYVKLEVLGRGRSVHPSGRGSRLGENTAQPALSSPWRDPSV